MAKLTESGLRRISAYFTPDEYDELKELADDEGVTVSAYVRARLLGVMVRHRGRPKVEVLPVKKRTARRRR